MNKVWNISILSFQHTIFSTKKQATTLHVVISTWQLSTSISYIYAFPVWSVASSSNRCCKVSTSALWDVWARRKWRSSGLRSSQQSHEQDTNDQWFMQLALEQRNHFKLKHVPLFWGGCLGEGSMESRSNSNVFLFQMSFLLCQNSKMLGSDGSTLVDWDLNNMSHRIYKHNLTNTKKHNVTFQVG